MTARTIRDSGYSGDLVIFTIDDRVSEFGRCINLASHPESHLIRTPKVGSFFHSGLCARFGYKSYCSPFDFFIIKTLPGNIIDKGDYDFILYMDSDMLVHSSLDEIFGYDTLVGDFNGRCAFRDVKGLSKYFSPEEVVLAKSRCGLGGGAFGVPSRLFDFFDRYREVYLRYINEVPHDQPCLSFTMIRYLGRFGYTRLENRRFWRHYWGSSGSKKLMIKDFNEKYKLY